MRAAIIASLMMCVSLGAAWGEDFVVDDSFAGITIENATAQPAAFGFLYDAEDALDVRRMGRIEIAPGVSMQVREYAPILPVMYPVFEMDGLRIRCGEVAAVENLTSIRAVLATDGLGARCNLVRSGGR